MQSPMDSTLRHVYPAGVRPQRFIGFPVPATAVGGRAGSGHEGRRRLCRSAGMRAVLLLLAACGGRAGAGDFSARALREAGDYSAGRRGTSLLVIQHGKTVFERYANGGSAGKAWPIYSGTKGFWAMTALAAAGEGILRLDERVSGTIGEWRSDPRKKDITIRELLDFTSGLDPCFALHSDRVADRNAAALRAPVVAARGGAFTYGPSHGQVLCEVLRRKLEPRGETPYGYQRRKLLGPLGIGDVEYRKDKRGNPLLASGLRLTARQWSRFGAFLLGRGARGGQVIVQEQWFEQGLRGSAANPSFGFGLWLNRGAKGAGARERDIEEMLELPWARQEWRGLCLCRAAPADLVAAVGSGYQRLFVIPSLDAVIVRQGSDAKFSDAEFLRVILRP